MLLAHAAATLVLVGVIWFVQLVHYPLFAGVGESGFVAYSREHQRRTTWVVAPPMLVEIATGAWLLFVPSPGLPRGPLLAGIALLGVIWASTGLLQVPLHRRLLDGYAEGTGRRLVLTNWVRTAAWTARGALVLWMVGRFLPGG